MLNSASKDKEKDIPSEHSSEDLDCMDMLKDKILRRLQLGVQGRHLKNMDSVRDKSDT